MDDSRTIKDVIRLLIIDGQPLVRLGLRKLLAEESAITVVGDAAYGEEIHATVAETEPDVILLDPGPVDLQCLSSLTRACKGSKACSIILFTTRDDREYITQATAQGVNGYLTKDCAQDDLLRAIHVVYKGGTMLSPNIAATLVQIFNGDNVQKPLPSQMLSGRELEVLNFMAKGISNRSIAKELFICEATVKFHVHSILGKLKVSNRTEAVLVAAQRGYIELSLN